MTQTQPQAQPHDHATPPALGEEEVIIGVEPTRDAADKIAAGAAKEGYHARVEESPFSGNFVVYSAAPARNPHGQEAA